jgi:tight adherence protein B
MRGLVALAAASAAWTLAGLPIPAAAQRHLPRPRPAMLVTAALAAAVGALTALSLGGNGPVAGAIGLMGAAAPAAISTARTRRVAEQAASRWPDFLAALRGRLSAGEDLPSATEGAAASAGDRLAGLSRRLAEGRATGRPFAVTLAEVRTVWADPLADRVLTALAAASGIGGDRVGAVLSGLAASVADELRLRRAHQAALTEQRLTGAVALGAPWALLLLSTATNPEAAAAYSTRTGLLVVLGGLAATTAGFWLSRRAARLSRMPRVFT